MRVGDFYEFYGEDAEIASREMEIALTSREDGKNNRVAMAGVPYHAVERYIAKLLQKNFKVALCDQVEDPRQAKGLVKRRVTRVITPGTLLEDSMLDAKQNNYLVAAVSGEPRHGLSVVDVSTGEFMATEIDGDQRQTKLLQEIMRLDPAEILVPEKDPDLADEIKLICDATITPYEDYSGPPITSKDYLQRHFETANLRGYGCEDYTSGLDAAALVLKYLRSNQVPTVQHITSLSTYSIDGFMHVDSIARRHLELTQNLSDGSRKNTLVTVLDHTETPMGARLLRRWIDEPLLDVASIELRLDSVEELAKEALRREEIREALHPISDLERLISRAATGT
ncbi:MAG: DNA mismatch repair protein MutS, partial [bacterium]